MEEWRDIKGFEGLYQVSNLGRIKSFKWGKEVIMKGCYNKLGYKKYTLSKDGKKHTKMLHRMVAEAFIPNPNNLPVINHKDENPSNNVWTNLEWCTVSYNNSYGTRLERLSKTKINGKTSRKVYQYTLDGELVKEYPSVQECGRCGFCVGVVSRCCLNKPHHNTYKGYKWSYAPL